MILDMNVERRIRELSGRAVASRNERELQQVITELRAALREHSKQFKALLAKYPFTRRAA